MATLNVADQKNQVIKVWAACRRSNDLDEVSSEILDLMRDTALERLDRISMRMNRTIPPFLLAKPVKED